jgi:XTP/dITP diphosphohydrolase
MNQLLFATNNDNKLREIRSQLGDSFSIVSLREANIIEEIPEPWPTIEENSTHKAKYIFDKYQLDCFSEDTGLIVPALNGEPGVKSARYAGDAASADDNISKLLSAMHGNINRNAYFKTVITYCQGGIMTQFQGICEGKLLDERMGIGGFGYDPIFVPNGAEICFAMMNAEEKNRFSHRRKAMDALINFLKK